MNIYKTQRTLAAAEVDAHKLLKAADRAANAGDLRKALAHTNRAHVIRADAIQTVLDGIADDLARMREDVGPSCEVEGCDRRGLAVTDDGVMCATHTRSAA